MPKNQHVAFFSLIKQLPEAKKEDIVFAFSEGKTTSLTEFHSSNHVGYNLMIRELQKRVSMEQERETKRLRSSILTRLQRYGINTTDWCEVNRFMEQPKIAGKRLYEMKHDEMRELIPKLESILRKTKEKEHQALKTAQLN
jgi:hypothetical protein